MVETRRNVTTGPESGTPARSAEGCGGGQSFLRLSTVNRTEKSSGLDAVNGAMGAQDVYYPTYNGERPWEDFFAEFKFIARIHGHTTNRAWLMCACMRGAALNFACRLPEETQDDFEELVKHLERRFKKKIPAYQHMQDLMSTKWNGAGDLAAHVDAIREHVEAVLEGIEDTERAVAERVTSQFFIASIDDVEARAAMARLDPGTPVSALAKTVGAIFEARTFAGRTACAGNEPPTATPHQWTEGEEITRPPRRTERTPERWNGDRNGHATRNFPKMARRVASEYIDEASSGNEE